MNYKQNYKVQVSPFDVIHLGEKLQELEKKTLEQGFWEDASSSGKILKEITNIKNKLEEYKK